MTAKHYSSEQWADYVRETAPLDQKAEMKRHLESGCKKCQKAARMWNSVHKVARREPGYRPRESAVRLAKSYFAMSDLRGQESLVPRLARLVFDSFREQQAAGIRSMALAARHYVYQSGPMLVDVWMQPASEAEPAIVTGQVLDRSIKNKAVPNVLVKLRGEGSDLSTTTTNQFGEFHFEIAKSDNVDLQLTIRKHDRIAVLIPLKPPGVV